MNELNKNNLDNLGSMFEQYEAPFSTDEMKADWQQVSTKMSSGTSTGQGGSSDSGYFGSLGVKIFAAIVSVAAIVGLSHLIFDTTNDDTLSKVSKSAAVVVLSEEDDVSKKKDEANFNIESEEPTNSFLTNETENSETPDTGKERKQQISTNSGVDEYSAKSDNGLPTKATEEKSEKVKAVAMVSTFEMCQGNNLKIKLSNADDDKIYFYRMVNQINGRVETGSLDNTKSLKLDVSGTYHLIVREMGNDNDRVLLDENVVVFEKPIAIMSFSKDDCGHYVFKDKSSKSKTAIWHLPSKSLSGKEVNYSFAKEGYQKVTLVVSNGNCSDTLTRDVLAEKSSSNAVSFNMPNIFTPNGDGDNDVFDIGKQNPFISDLKGTIEIYDARNVSVFKSINGLSDKWNGKMMNVGRDCENGFYTYIIKYENECSADKQDVVSGLISITR